MPDPPEVAPGTPAAGAVAAALAAGLSPRIRPGSPAGGPTAVVAVDGWSGSGKTGLAGPLGAALGAPCVHLDDFVPGWHGLARSVELLVAWVLRPLAAGRPARWRPWDWSGGRPGDWVALPGAPPVVVVEGCGAGAAAARPWLAALVWLDVDAGERRRRLEARPDWATYEPWVEVWAGQERALRAGDDPSGHADVVVRHRGAAGPTLHWRPPTS